MSRDIHEHDHLSPLDAVVTAWAGSGGVSAYHAFMQVRLEMEWPLLARALDRLVLAHALDRLEQENQQKEKDHESA